MKAALPSPDRLFEEYLLTPNRSRGLLSATRWMMIAAKDYRPLSWSGPEETRRAQKMSSVIER
jgi:hypothetical protein